MEVGAMPPRRKRATLARSTRRPYVEDATWDSDDIAAGDALTVGHLFTVLLDRYAAGVVDERRRRAQSRPPTGRYGVR
jgi:hypothetical protein